MFLIISLLTIFQTTSSFAADAYAEFKGCGEYSIAGEFALTKDPLQINYIVYQGSKSETKLMIKADAGPKAAPYLNRTSVVHGKILKTINNQLGELEIIDIKSRIGNPMKGAKDSGFKLIKAYNCL